MHETIFTYGYICAFVLENHPFVIHETRTPAFSRNTLSLYLTAAITHFISNLTSRSQVSAVASIILILYMSL